MTIVAPLALMKVANRRLPSDPLTCTLLSISLRPMSWAIRNWLSFFLLLLPPLISHEGGDPWLPHPAQYVVIYDLSIERGELSTWTGVLARDARKWQAKEATPIQSLRYRLEGKKSYI